MTAHIGVVQFPGTNCEQDVAWAVKVLGGKPEMLWHADRSVALHTLAKQLRQAARQR